MSRTTLKITGQLREVLLALLMGDATREQLNHLIAVSHSLASSFIAGKSSLGGLRSISGLTTSDLAFDAIADLFRLDEHGNCVQLRAYFAGIDLREAEEEEIVSHLRRLVFSKVNQGIFRLYSEADPALAKILRNLKLAVGTLKNFTEVERFGEICLAPALCDTLEHLPPFDRDELEKRLHEYTTGREMIPELTAKMSLVLRQQEEYCRIVPLVTVGLLFRAVYGNKEDAAAAKVHHDDHFGKADAQSVVSQVCRELKAELHPTYVGRQKLTEELYQKYFKAIESELLGRMEIAGVDGISLFDRLKAEIPGITRAEYFREHRNKLEYLLKLASGKMRKAVM